MPYFSSNDGYYKVIKGDTLYSIAKKFNMSIDKLKELNNLSSNLINVGDLLKINQGTTVDTGDNYIVQSGDTLYSIAKKFNINVDELKRLNNLDNNMISIGQNLLIKPKKDEPITNLNSYTVQSGDTLYSIAKAFNTTVSNIKTINDLSSNILSIGQIIKVPTEEDYNIYTVKSGDTLYSIARMFNVTVSELQDINNLSTSILSVGEKLIIPKK